MPRTNNSQKEQLNRRVKELEFLAKSSHTLNSTLDIDRVLDRIMRIVREALNVETVSVLFFDKEKKRMVFEIARGKRGRDIVGLRIPLGEGVVGWVARYKRPVIINDLRKDRRYSARLDKELGLKTHSIMSVPLMRANKMIGVIEAVNRRGKEPFTKDDLRLFLALGDHIATALENARLYRKIRRAHLENSLLYEMNVVLGKALSLDEVLEEILKSLHKLLSLDAAAIFVLDRNNKELVSFLQKGYDPGDHQHLRLKLDEGIVGWAARYKKGVIVPDTSKDSRYVPARKATRSEMVAPMLSGGEVIGLFNIESNHTAAYRRSDLVLLEAFAAQAGVSIERARLYEEQQEKREIERELKVARTVQQFFTPKKSQRVGQFTLTGRNYPSLELSGDYLDIFPIKKPYQAFAIADVAGKGVPASIIVSGFRAVLHTGARYFTHASQIARRANEILLETVRPHDFVTAFIGVLNPETGEVTYCNAGHNPPILMKPNGRYKYLETGGAILGVLEDNDLHEGRFVLEDEVLLVYTDGVIDAADPRDRPFGQQRLVRFLKDHRELSTSQICTALRKHLKQFMGNTPPIDDLTFLVIKK